MLVSDATPTKVLCDAKATNNKVLEVIHKKYLCSDVDVDVVMCVVDVRRSLQQDFGTRARD